MSKSSDERKETLIETKVTYTVELDGKFYIVEHVPVSTLGVHPRSSAVSIDERS